MTSPTKGNLVPVRLLDLHFPVISVKRKPNGNGWETLKPWIYGTAFPIGSGLFATAGHVIRDAAADGAVALTRFEGMGQGLRLYRVESMEITKDIDFGLMYAPEVKVTWPVPLDFGRTLDLLDSVEATGWPMAVDPEWVSIVHRSFKGHVITRRSLYQLPGQPPGYEFSFAAPAGLSGAPLISHVAGDPRCYGYVIQGSQIGTGNGEISVGIAVDISVLLSVTSQIIKAPLANLFGRKQMPKPAVTPPALPGGIAVDETSLEGWPAEDADVLET